MTQKLTQIGLGKQKGNLVVLVAEEMDGRCCLRAPISCPQEDEKYETGYQGYLCPRLLIGVLLGKGLRDPTSLRNTGTNRKNSQPGFLQPLK